MEKTILTIYYRPPTNQDGSRKSFTQRRAERRQQDTERRATQMQEPTDRDSIFNLPYHERRQLRRAERQGQYEAEQNRRIEEQTKRQAEIDALPEHEKRPGNPWRDLIELRKKDSWRKDVAQRIKVYEREARIEDERIDALMAEKKRRHELESDNEYAKALAHWERADQSAENEDERESLARLRGLIEGGDFGGYWQECQPLMESRLQRIREQMVEQAAEQAPFAEKSKVLAEQQKAAEELQVIPEESEKKKEVVQ